MSDVSDVTAEDMRAELSSALNGLDGGRSSRMGAGSDDVEGPREYLRALSGGGWITPTWPVQYGGRGASPTEAAAVQDTLSEFPRRDLYPFMVGLYLVGPTVLTHGNEAQKDRWLRSIVDGGEIWCQMFSEPEAGSDLANVATSARREGDGWRLSGQKVWTSRGSYANWGMCLARTDPDVPKHKGLTMFAIRMDAPGVDVRILKQMNGDLHFSEVFLDDVYVCDADRVGGVGEGWKVTLTVLAHERGGMQGGGSRAAPSGDHIGLPAWLSELAAAGALKDPVLRERAVQVYIMESVTQLTQSRASANAQAKNAPGPEGSGQKLRTASLFKLRAELLKDAQGLGGLLTTTPGHIEFLTAPSMSIRGGTDEIQRNIIGERILGLAQEPRVDRDIPWSQARTMG